MSADKLERSSTDGKKSGGNLKTASFGNIGLPEESHVSEESTENLKPEQSWIAEYKMLKTKKQRLSKDNLNERDILVRTFGPDHVVWETSEDYGSFSPNIETLRSIRGDSGQADLYDYDSQGNIRGIGAADQRFGDRYRTGKSRRDGFDEQEEMLEDELEFLEEVSYGEGVCEEEKMKKPCETDFRKPKEPCMPCMDGFMETILMLQTTEDVKDEGSADDVGVARQGSPCDVGETKPPKADIHATPKELSEKQMEALLYLHEKHIEELFAFMINHVLVQAPEDTLSFLVKFVAKCIKFIEGKGDPPLIFDLGHQAIMYKALDPSDAGIITYEQYCNGLKTMGLKRFNLEPERTENGLIEKDIFLKEADKALMESLVELLCTRSDITPTQKAELAVRKIIKPPEDECSSFSLTTSFEGEDEEECEAQEGDDNYFGGEYPTRMDSKELFALHYNNDLKEEFRAPPITMDSFNEIHDRVILEEIVMKQAELVADQVIERQTTEIQQVVMKLAQDIQEELTLPDIDEEEDLQTK